MAGRDEMWAEIQRIDSIVVRIDERTKSIRDEVKALGDVKVNIDRFTPVEKIAYGLVTLILAGVCGSLLTLVLA